MLSRLSTALAAYSTPSSPTMSFKVLGVATLFTADPRNVQAMLATEWKTWSTSPRRTDLSMGIGRILDAGVFTTEGEEWKGSRELLRGVLRGRILRM
jgi:hypothetical protein